MAIYVRLMPFCHFRILTGRSWNEWEKTVPNRKRLIEELESYITEDGRYHIDWFWNTQSKRTLNGHIITLEKIGDTLRYYDPQNGKVIDNFYDYIADIKLNRGIRLLRVDNLRVNPEYASHILGKSGSGVVGGIAGKSVTGGSKETIADLIRQRNEAASNTERVAITKKIIEDPNFKAIRQLSTKDHSIYTLNPEELDVPTNQKELPKNLAMAQKMVRNGYDAYLLSNPHGMKSADFVFVKNGKVYYMEGKLSTGKNSFSHNLSDASTQSERILIDVASLRNSKKIAKELMDAFNNNDRLQGIKLLKGGREISVTRSRISKKNFQYDFKREWEQKK